MQILILSIGIFLTLTDYSNALDCKRPMCVELNGSLKFPIMNDPSHYYQCVAPLISIRRRCKDFEMFDYESQSCVDEKNRREVCDKEFDLFEEGETTTETLNPSLPVPNCQIPNCKIEENIKIKWPTPIPSNFYECELNANTNEYEPILQKCSGIRLKYFDYYRQECVGGNDWNPVCDDHVETTTTEANTETTTQGNTETTTEGNTETTTQGNTETTTQGNTETTTEGNTETTTEGNTETTTEVNTETTTEVNTETSTQENTETTTQGNTETTTEGNTETTTEVNTESTTENYETTNEPTEENTESTTEDYETTNEPTEENTESTTEDYETTNESTEENTESTTEDYETTNEPTEENTESTTEDYETTYETTEENTESTTEDYETTTDEPTTEVSSTTTSTSSPPPELPWPVQCDNPKCKVESYRNVLWPAKLPGYFYKCVRDGTSDNYIPMVVWCDDIELSFFDYNKQTCVRANEWTAVCNVITTQGPPSTTTTQSTTVSTSTTPEGSTNDTPSTIEDISTTEGTTEEGSSTTSLSTTTSDPEPSLPWPVSCDNPKCKVESYRNVLWPTFIPRNYYACVRDGDTDNYIPMLKKCEDNELSHFDYRRQACVRANDWNNICNAKPFKIYI
uniref:CSON000998 protein n=1 Tax=Culicoides sonorensis TaxID=179676 RepID=A0A336MID4_CULSO